MLQDTEVAKRDRGKFTALILSSYGFDKVHALDETPIWHPIVALFAILLLHELGHVAFGVAMGFRFVFLVTGPICIQRKNERLTFRFNFNPALWGPRAGCLPTTFGPELKRKMLWFTAGGPLFSVLGAMALLPGWWLRDSFLLWTGFLSAMIALATAVPMTMMGATSDGARLLMLWRNLPEGTRWIAMSALGGLSRETRPRDWPPGLLELLGDGLDERPDASSACALRYLFHADRREWEAAAQWMDRALARIDCVAKSLRSGVYYCAAWLEVRYRHDAVKARHYFDLGAKLGYTKPKDVPAIAAGVLIAEGRLEEARAELAMAEASLPSKPPAIAACLREDIAELRMLL
jgi:hypothetical protein